MRHLLRDLPRILEKHDAIVVATRDAALRPCLALAVGYRAAGDSSRVTVYVPEATGQATFENLADNGLVAVAFEEVTTHRAVQLKGRCTETRPATDEERAAVDRCSDSFCDMVAWAGAPLAAVKRQTRWPCRAVTFEVTDVFEQTPGPGPGCPMAPGGHS